MKAKKKQPQKKGLVEAAADGDIDLVRRLIAEGVDVNVLSDDGCSALFMAVANGYSDLVHLLLQNGADTNARSYDCPPVLIAAMQREDLGILRTLLEHGADVNATGYYDDHSALSYAAETGNAEALRLLLEYGAAAVQDDARVKAILMLAKEKGHDDLALAIAEERGYRALADWLRQVAVKE